MMDPMMTMMMFVYQCTLFVMFTCLYNAIGFSSNFNLPDDYSMRSVSPVTVVYFSAAAQTTTGFGDIHPKTDSARLLVLIHVICAWIPMLLIFT